MKAAAYVLLLLVILALSAPGFAAAPDVGRSRALARRYVGQVVNGRRLEVLDQLVAPNYKRHVRATEAPLNLEGHKQRLAGFFIVFPDLRCTIEDIVAEGNRLAWRNTCHGTHLGRGLMGLAPTGKQMEIGESFFARIENGKFVEMWGGPDTWLLLQQLGVQVRMP